MNVIVLSLGLVIAVSACSSVPRKTNYTRLDENTTYFVQPQKDGFELSIQHEKKQRAPNLDALIISCKSALTSLAYDLAKKQNRKLTPINEQQIKLTTDRYIENLIGISLCNASVSVEYAR